MSIAWEIFNILVAGIPAYLLVALIFQLFKPQNNYFRAFGIYQLLVEPIIEGDPKKLLSGKLPEIINIPLYPIFLIFLLGIFGYGITDIVLDSVPSQIININIHAKDNEAIYKAYKDNQQLVFGLDDRSSIIESPVIKKLTKNFYNSSSQDREISKQIYEYHKEWLRSKDKFYSSGCGQSRIQVRAARQLFSYSIVLSLVVLARLCISCRLLSKESKIERNEQDKLNYKNKQKKWNYKLVSPRRLFYLLVLSIILIVSSYFLWGMLNKNYYEKVIMTYHIESSVSPEK